MKKSIFRTHLNTENPFFNGSVSNSFCNPIGISENNKENNIRVTPNPFYEKTTINFPNPKQSNYKLSVFSFSGNKVFELNNIKTDKIEFERGNLPNGIYIMVVKGEKVFNNKMIIIK